MVLIMDKKTLRIVIGEEMKEVLDEIDILDKSGLNNFLRLLEVHRGLLMGMTPEQKRELDTPLNSIFVCDLVKDYALLRLGELNADAS
jgi:hypothetical protein